MNDKSVWMIDATPKQLRKFIRVLKRLQRMERLKIKWKRIMRWCRK